MKKIISTNPAKNYKVIGEVEISSDKEIKEKVENANRVKLTWKELGIKERISLLRPIYDEFLKRRKEIVKLITKEVGKIIKESELEVDGYLDDFKWFLDNGEEILQNEITYQDKNSIHKIVYEPYGTAAVITPWNFPFGMFLWGVVPNLIAGNTIVFKISEECSLTGKLIEEIMLSKNFPDGVFSEVYGAGDVGKKLVESNINIIWFTGSTKTGQLLYKIAADKFIKAIFELGGSNPAVVFDDVIIDDIIPELYTKRFKNCGQICASVKRLIVHESIFDKVVKKLKKEVEEKVIGNPEQAETNISSLVAKRQLDLLKNQVKDATDKGAKIVTGGKSPINLKGAYYLPTILTNIKKSMRVWEEGVFGPILPIISFKTEEEAVMLANDTIYGLGARVYSKDKERAKRVASKIDAGSIDINKASSFLIQNPFGGYKFSGMGREGGKHGFQELCQIKVISMEK